MPRRRNGVLNSSSHVKVARQFEMEREGQIDPLFGQRPAFHCVPVGDLATDEDIAVHAYIQQVRDEAERIVFQPAMTRDTDGARAVTTESPRKKAKIQKNESELSIEEKLPLDSIVAVLEPVVGSLTQEPEETLSSLIARARKNWLAMSRNVDNRPNCSSRAQWRENVVGNPPTPLDHEDSMRMAKYMSKWATATPIAPFLDWFLFICLGLRDLLEGEEIATLREAIRAFDAVDLAEGHLELQLAKYIIATQWGQLDLLQVI